MRTLFLDTSFIIALEASSDQGHLRALQVWRDLAREPNRIVTTSLVIVEIGAFFSRLPLRQLGISIIKRLLSSDGCRIVHVDEESMAAGWNLYARSTDKEYSLVDCVSFVVMRQEEIFEALTFDHHFEQAGFTRLPA